MLVIIGVLTACQFASRDQTPEKSLKIMVSIPPQAYWVERIGGDAVKVETMLPAGAEPHTYEPSPDQLKTMSRADAYFRIRIGFEDAWMKRFSDINPNMKVVDLTDAIQRMPLPAQTEQLEKTIRENHTASARKFHHEDNNFDPHVWLSPRLATSQVKTIFTTLSQLEPNRSAEFQANLKSLLKDITQLDEDIQNSLKNIRNPQFLVFHPAWGYFARDYNLSMLAIEVGGQEPSAAELTALIRLAKAQKIKVVFASPQFSRRAAETIAKEIGGKVLLIDPLAYDWIDNLHQVAQTFSEAL